MKEATEIAKLRLFLKLVSVIDKDNTKTNMGLVPLPDIDFNIRSGNTLIGYVSEEEVIESIEKAIDFDNDLEKITEQCERVKIAFNDFKNSQIENEHDTSELRLHKSLLNEDLNKLNESLNVLLHDRYYSYIKYEDWKKSHIPFHWFSQFYEIMHNKKGFDVVIGNPPYVEYNSLKFYSIKNLNSIRCGNLFATVIERGVQILNTTKKMGLIVPISLTCSKRMEYVQDILLNSGAYISNWAWRPSKLFDGADKANLSLSIFLLNNSKNIFTTNYIRWNAESRSIIFENFNYKLNQFCNKPIFPKYGSEFDKTIINKFSASKKFEFILCKANSDNRLYYRRTGGLYWKIFTDFRPVVILNGNETFSSKEEYFPFDNELMLKISITVLWSDIFWWWYQTRSDVRNNNPSDFKTFLIPEEIYNSKELLNLSEILLKDLIQNSVWDERKFKGNISRFQKFFPKYSKRIIEKIDYILGNYYKFNEVELDYIMNYEIKYRMGKDIDEEED